MEPGRLIPVRALVSRVRSENFSIQKQNFQKTAGERRMFSLSYSSAPSSARTICNSNSLSFLQTRKPSISRVFSIISSSPIVDSVTDESTEEDHFVRNSGNYAGAKLEEINGGEKLRLDTWISSRMSGVSRARVQSSIKSGLVKVNGRVVNKVSHVIRAGDKVNCTISEMQPLRAEPEDIPLNIVFEDDHVLVVNKPAHMVVHPAPGNRTGTLVSGILHHCRLPTVALPDNDIFSETEDISDEELEGFYSDQNSSEDLNSRSSAALIRPGIVHRLDKGTSGLLVVAKDEHSHAHLSEQFKLHTIHRVYVSLTNGVPSPASGRVDIAIGRDTNNRLRMTAVNGSNNTKQARNAASRYRVIEVLAGGASAMVEWRLETGRTHQIRAHAKYLGYPLLGDEVYGGTKGMALSLLRHKTPSNRHNYLPELVDKFQRPCLHAYALGFKHPHTGKDMKFSCPPPADFTEILSLLQNIEKLSFQK